MKLLKCTAVGMLCGTALVYGVVLAAAQAFALYARLKYPSNHDLYMVGVHFQYVLALFLVGFVAGFFFMLRRQKGQPEGNRA